MNQQTIVDGYRARLPAYRSFSANLEEELKGCLEGFGRIDRISTRVKDEDSFAEKVFIRKAGEYADPILEVEDQIAARVIVFFLKDVTSVSQRIVEYFSAVEAETKQPTELDRFGYQSSHFVIQVPIQCLPPEWSEFDDMPQTIELQIRTLFMHAWAEPQHDLGYKGTDSISDEDKRMLYWVAASAWGCDKAYQDLIGKVES